MERGVFVAGEKAARVVETHAKLPASNGVLLDERAVFPAVALRPVGGMQPVVHAVAESVRRVLRVAGHAHPADLRALVAAQVAMRGLAKPKLRRLLQKHAAFHKSERARHHEIVEEDGALIHAPVAVGVFQHHDAADRIALAAACEIAHVALIFDDPDPAIGIELEEDGVVDERLGGDEFDAVAGRKLEGLCLLLRCAYGSGRDLDALQQCLSLFPIGMACERGRRARARTFGRNGLGQCERSGESR